MGKINIKLARKLLNEGVTQFNSEVNSDGDKIFTKFELDLINELGGTEEAKLKILRVMRRSFSTGYAKAICIERKL